jgi:hypothetical protein
MALVPPDGSWQKYIRTGKVDLLTGWNRREGGWFHRFVVGGMHEEVRLNLRDKPGMERWKYTAELGKHGKGAVHRLVQTLKEEDKWVRCLVVDALGNIHDPCVVAPLISALGDPDQDVRFTAVRALGKVGGGLAREALEWTREADNSYVRSAAEEALAGLMN